MFHRDSYMPQNHYLNLPTEFRNMFFLRKQKLPLFLVCDDKWMPDITKSFKFSFPLCVFLILVISFFPCSHNDYMFIIESEQTLGDSEEQRRQACCSPQDHKESEKTEQLNNKNSAFSQSTCIIYILFDEFFLKDLFIINLFIYLFLAALGLPCFTQAFSSFSKREPVSSCGEQLSHWDAFSCGASILWARASVVAVCCLSSSGSRALESRVSTCGPLAQLPLCMWAFPKAGVKLMSTALAGGFSTTDHQRIPISNEFSKVSFKLVILMTNSLNFFLKMALYSKFFLIVLANKILGIFFFNMKSLNISVNLILVLVYVCPGKKSNLIVVFSCT